MQTLNVGAGRSDAEYRHAEEERLTELRDDSRTDANFFFIAAGLAMLGTGLLPIRLGFLVNVGLIDLLTFYGRALGPAHLLVLWSAAALWVLAMVGLGIAGRSGQRWAFLAGIVLYAIDMIALIVTFSVWAFGVHGFFVYKWWQGQSALRELHDADCTTP